MVRRITSILGIGLFAIALAVFLVPGTGDDGDYRVHMEMSNAAGLIEGSTVTIGGVAAGEIETLDVRDGKAQVEVRLDGEHGSLHEGTTGKVIWAAVLGERSIEIVPGPSENAEIPAGGTIPVSREQVNVDDLLASLDTKTRKRLSGTVRELSATLDGREEDLAEVLEVGGPSVEALGEVMKAVGQDSHAIRRLVTDLSKLVAPVARRDGKLTRTVDNLTTTATSVAQRESSLSSALGELPSTLRSADRMLQEVGPAVEETSPLLEDLAPVTKELTPVTRKLAPVLQDLRPTVANLRPVVSSANRLLTKTPRLLDNAHAVLPGLTSTVDDLNPAVDFLRPYTPDLMGWLTNWGGAFAGYDSVGHYASGLISAGVSSLDENPGVPLTVNTTEPAPGLAGGDPWTDANGSGMQ